MYRKKFSGTTIHFQKKKNLFFDLKRIDFDETWLLSMEKVRSINRLPSKRQRKRRNERISGKGDR